MLQTALPRHSNVGDAGEVNRFPQRVTVSIHGIGEMHLIATVLNWLYAPIYRLFNGLYVAVYNVLSFVIGGLIMATEVCGGLPVAAIVAECTRRLLGLSVGSLAFGALFSILALASFIPSIWLVGTTFAFTNDNQRPR